MLSWFQFLLLAAAWGGSYFFLRQVADALPPEVTSGYRIGVAALILLPFAWPNRGGLLRQWKLVLLSGLTNTALPMSLLAWVMKFLPAAHGSIINASAPLFAGVVGTLFFGVRASRLVWAGLFLGLAGIVVTMEPWGSGHHPALVPVLVALCAMASYGFGINLAHKVKGIPPVANAAGTMAAGSLLTLPMMVAFWPKGPVAPGAWVSATALGVVSTGLAFVLFYRLLEKWGAMRTAMVTYVAPFFAMLWGVLFLSEAVKGAWLPGLALVLLGLHLGTRQVPARERG